MYRVRENPVFDIATGAFLSCDGESFVEDFPVKCDRGVANQAGANAKVAGGVSGKAGADASQVGSSFIPGLERDANNPTGFTAQQKNNMLVSGAESTGGAAGAARGTADLTALRTGNAGNFADALQNVARSRMQANSKNALDVQNADAELAQTKQAQARSALQGLYGTDTSNQLKAMGLQNDDLQSQLAAKKQGWVQNTLDTINTIAGAGKAAGSMGVGFGSGQSFG